MLALDQSSVLDQLAEPDQPGLSMVRSDLPPACETTLRWTVDREDAVGSLSESQSTGQTVVHTI
jgi:hypothetical protein